MPRTIVPLVFAEELIAAAAPAGHLVYHSGKVLTAVEVVTIFWGAEWQQAPQSALIGQLNGFFDFVLTSTLMDMLAEYNVPGQSIGHGRRTGTATITTSEPGQPVAGGGREIADQQIQQALQAWIAAHTVPQTTPNTLYFIYLPSGVTSVLGPDRSCQMFCGYHSHIASTVFYAVEPFLTCNGCTFGTTLQSLTKVSSHELCEAITDANGDGWFEDTGAGNEIGDICNRDVQQLGGFTVQGEWSNRANQCLIRPRPTRRRPPPRHP